MILPLLVTLLLPAIAAEPPLILEDRLTPDHPDMKSILSPEWSEPAAVPQATTRFAPVPQTSGVIAPAARQPAGALSGRIVFMNGGHGWTYDPTFSPPWRLLRGNLQEMNEDHGNIDQLNFFALYCFNAGAVVVPFRPIGQQTNEVVLDNDDAGVMFNGTWSTSSSTLFYGSAGDVPYRYASLSATETATATYTPNLPLTDYYPVYTWVAHGSNRGDQLYRIRHTGGESQVRVPHHMVGNGWVYLGEYYFNAGSNAENGSVVISNLRETATGSVVVADAIRFGNGMGSADNGGGGSKYPRECESARYWIKNSLGQGQSTSLYDGSGDDESDSWSAPPKMSAEMNREASGGVYDRIHISFHSNASAGASRGTVALITSDPTPNQSALANTAGGEVNDDLVALGSPPLETAWYNRGTHTYTGGYSEIDGSYFNYEMDATIIEVAFHDNEIDAQLLRDSKARAAVGKAAMHAVIKHLHTYNTGNPPPLAYLPEPPTNPRAVAGANGAISLSWSAPVNVGGSQNPTNYTLYRSTNGYGFGNPVFVGNVTTYTVSNLAANVDYYFRVAASNAGGESMPSEVVGCRASSVAGVPRALVVNAFDRFDRTTNLRQDTTRQSYTPPDSTGAIERVWPRRVNSFDYVVPHGKAISASGMAFDSCQRQAVTNGSVALTNYPIVVWESGQSQAGTFETTDQNLITAFLNAGGNLFVSGAKIAYDLDRSTGPTTADRNFLKNQLHADLTADANTNAASYTFSPVAGSIFGGNSNGTIDNGAKGIYWVQTADVVSPYGNGATAAINYTGNANGAAGVQYDGSAGGGKVVYFGFPFETITSSARRDAYMADILTFFSVDIAPYILSQPQPQTVNQGADATFSVTAGGSAPLAFQWHFSGTNIPGATTSSYTRTKAQEPDIGEYLVVVTNGAGSITSTAAALNLNFPPVIGGQPVSQVVTQGVDVTFGVSATGTVPLKYQWRLNNNNLAGATLSAYTRNHVQAGDAGSYSVVITNVAGATTSGAATLTVLIPPSIVTQPTDLVTGLGLTATFTVAATGTEPLTWQWRHNGTNLAGATANSLLLGSVKHSDAGPYLVIVSNSIGTTSSVEALLTVSDPYLLTQPQSQSVAAGATASFEVSVVGTLPLSYRWRKNGMDLADGGNIFGTGTSILTLTNVQGQDMGNYSVLVSNSHGALTSSNATLIAPFAPVILAGPSSRKVVAGSAASLTVEALGPGTLIYQWLREGTNLVDGGKISGAATANLLVTSFEAGEVANYAVVISNSYGPVVSSNALLSEWPLAAWGYNNYLQTDVPSGLSNLLAIASGYYHALALRADGTVSGWGAGTNYTGVIPYFGQAIAPNGLTAVRSLAGGGYHSLALTADGLVVAWGAGTNYGTSPRYGQSIVPAGVTQVEAITAGLFHSLALKADGTVVGWGAGTNNTGASPHFGQALIPDGLSNVVAIASGSYHNLARKADGSLVAWGAGTSNTGTSPHYGQSIIPPALTNVVAIACGSYHSLAVKADGTVVSWGFNNSGQTNVPAGLSGVVGVGGGIGYSLALREDGALVGWGSSLYGQTNIPPGVANVTAIGCGGLYALALQNDGRPCFLVQPRSQMAAAGEAVFFKVVAVGASPMSYQWQHEGTNIVGATGANLILTDVQDGDAGGYSVAVTNLAGFAVSTEAQLTVPATQPLRFDAITLLPENQVKLVLSGPAGNYSVQLSSNLTGWWPWTNIALTNSTAELIDTVTSDNAQRFYRAISAP